MADINKAFTTKYGLSLADVVGVFQTTVDPTGGTEPAPKGSLMLRRPAGSPLGEIYLKTDTADTAWVKLFDRKCVFSATAAPTAASDNTQGYASGSIWVDTTHDKAYICLDATTSAAIWQYIGTGSSAANTAFSVSFVDDNLTAGVFRIIHSLNSYDCIVSIQDNDRKIAVPDDITIIDSNTIDVTLTTYGTLLGTWYATVLTNGGASPADWSAITGKPSTFTPSTHGNETHTSTFITAADVTWTNVSGKPTSFTPTSHGNEAHSTAFVSVTEINATNDRLAFIESTCLIAGFELSINADTTKFDVGAGIGVIVDNYTDPENPVRTLISEPAKLAQINPHLATSTGVYIGIDINGDIIHSESEFTSEERRTIISIGWLDHPDNTTITTARRQPDINSMVAAQISDFILSFGSFNIWGNQYIYGSNNLTIKRSAGATFEIQGNYDTLKQSPNIIETDIENQIEFVYYYRNGVDDWVNDLASTTTIDPNNWDDNSGTLQAVPSQNWTIQPIMYYAQMLANDIQYGQAVYTTKEAAKSALHQAIEINPYNSYDTFRGWLIVKQGATDLSNIAQAEFINAGKLGLIDIASGGGSGGEINTASNIGTQGLGLYKDKNGVDLHFRNIRGTNGVSLVQNNTYDTLDVSIGILNKTIAYSGETLQTITDSDGTKTFGYNPDGTLNTITGTGKYVNKAFTYSSGQLIGITVS